jgi:hypothetical protein
MKMRATHAKPSPVEKHLPEWENGLCGHFIVLKTHTLSVNFALQQFVSARESNYAAQESRTDSVSSSQRYRRYSVQTAIS